MVFVGAVRVHTIGMEKVPLRCLPLPTMGGKMGFNCPNGYDASVLRDLVIAGWERVSCSVEGTVDDGWTRFGG